MNKYQKEKNKIKCKLYRINNKEKIKEYERKRPKRSFVSIAKYRKTEKGKAYTKEYNKTHPRKYNSEKELPYLKNLYHTNIQFRIKLLLRSRLNAILRLKAENKKQASAIRDLGCSIDELKLYIEKQWQEGMNWENLGRLNKLKKTWQIDHIKPLSSFNLSNIEEQKKAIHYTNLQPLWAFDNLLKGNKLINTS